MSRFKEYDNRNSNYLLSTARPDNRSLNNRNNSSILSVTKPSNTSLNNNMNNTNGLKTK